MVFIDIDLNEWLKTYPELKILETECDCGHLLKSTIPFRTREYAGIISELCKCGNKLQCASMVIICKEEIEY